MDIDAMISEITDILKEIAVGPCSIALAGSHAKGESDGASDIDFYMLINDLKPRDEMFGIICSAADEPSAVYISDSFDSAPYGGGIDFCYKGIPIEVTVRFFSLVKKRIDECVDGNFEIIPQTWTSNGYYTFIYLSEIDFVKPVFESDGFIEGYKEKLKDYPEKLRKSIITCFWGRANTWLYNFHYESAIERGDILFTAPIVLHTVLDMVQVIFALNRKYFSGDKRLEAALHKIAYCPKDLLQNITFLLSASNDRDILRRQYEILLSVRSELLERIEKEVF